jgi:pyruvate/2-oxoglutarate dehydrogenase complex dihydrolipoamide dehydrogenase (E3) component
MYDVIVVGGGPAGVTAALQARELGAKTALVERGRLGGTCTNDGCVPTRVLAKAARLMRDYQQMAHYGLKTRGAPEVDFPAVLARAGQVVYQMHEKKQLIDHLQDVQVDLFSEVGDAAFIDAHTLSLPDGRTLTGDRFILCVGGSARRLPIPGGEHALTHSDVWTMKKLPRSVAIIGTGATGCQLASILNAFGVHVVLLDIAPRILPPEDADVAALVQAEFKANGIDVITGISGVDRIEKFGGATRLVYSKNDIQHTHPVGAVIIAVGWPGNVDALRLDQAGVAVERNYIVTDTHLKTTADHIYAAGDITGRMMLVQSAGSQARAAVENALSHADQAAEHRLVPHGGFTDPEYAGVGLTEDAARQQNLDYVVATVPYADLDRAVIDDRTVGLFKLIADRASHRVLGAHIVGEQAVEVAQLVAAGMAGEITVDQLAEMELAYPTFAAIVGLAARQIIREVGAVEIAPEWRALEKVRGIEWERQEAMD